MTLLCKYSKVDSNSKSKIFKISKRKTRTFKKYWLCSNACEEQWNANYRLAKNYREYYDHAISLV